MDLSDLHIFRTVAYEGGIVKASRKLHRVPSSVSTRVKQLEESLGSVLFHRERQRLALTTEGKVLLTYAEKLLQLSEEARSALSGAAPRGVLRLGALESTAASRLPPLLAAYHRKYPDVTVELKTGTNDALTAAVAERALDAAFVAERPSHEALSSTPAFRERLVIVAPAAHAPIARPGDIDGLSLIAFPDGCAYRRVMLRWLGAKRISSIRVLELASYHAIIACVAAGTGIAIVPESVLAAVNTAEVAKYKLPKVYAELTTPLVWRVGDVSPALAALRDELVPRAASKPLSRTT
jgi:DNA-binding transcriptional LysR family regulator